MTSTSSSALQAMREAHRQLENGLDIQFGDPDQAREYFRTVHRLLQGAIAREEAQHDPRVEVLARVLEPAAFDDTPESEHWTADQRAELRETTIQTARQQLVALDSLERDNFNRRAIDATIGR